MEPASTKGVAMTLGHHILETLRQHMGLSIGEVQMVDVDGRQVWRIDATDPKGERWVATDEDHYKAACLLATAVGFDLEG